MLARIKVHCRTKGQDTHESSTVYKLCFICRKQKLPFLKIGRKRGSVSIFSQQEVKNISKSGHHLFFFYFQLTCQKLSLSIRPCKKETSSVSTYLSKKIFCSRANEKKYITTSERAKIIIYLSFWFLNVNCILITFLSIFIPSCAI